MTNPPDRVWVTIDRSGHPQYAAPYREAANEHINDAIDRHVPGAGGWVIREYRLHRPIPWRTGVPDAETVARCSNSFAVLIPNGTVLRFAERKHQHWYWHSTPAFRGGGLSLHNAVSGWCPEDEMPKGGA